MKIIKTCDHLIISTQSLVKELFRPEHDGRFFIVTELCKDCFTEVITQQDVNKLV